MSATDPDLNSDLKPAPNNNNSGAGLPGDRFTKQYYLIPNKNII